MRINDQIQRDIKQVKTVNTDEEANDLLKAGWIILHGGLAHVDDMGYNAKVHFIMARI